MSTCFHSWVRGALLLALVLVLLSAGGLTPAAAKLHAEAGGGFHVQRVPAPQTGVIIICDEDDCSLA